jgi:hypothetical protein
MPCEDQTDVKDGSGEVQNWVEFVEETIVFNQKADISSCSVEVLEDVNEEEGEGNLSDEEADSFAVEFMKSGEDPDAEINNLLETFGVFAGPQEENESMYGGMIRNDRFKAI